MPLQITHAPATFQKPPEFLGPLDVGLLPRLATAGQQYYDTCTVDSEVDSVSRSDIEAKFVNSIAKTFDVRPATLREPSECGSNTSRDRCIEIIEPLAKRTVTRRTDVLDDLDRM
jgi:hypothetical protein